MPTLVLPTGSESVLLRSSCVFPQVSSEVREGSIRLFKEVMDAVVWCKKANMKKAVRRGLLPLLFQMSDETPSVAQVRISDLTNIRARVC